MKKRININEAAKIANGKSQSCAKCPLKNSMGVCLPKYQRVCSDAFVEGFKKGAKYYKSQQEMKSFIDMANDYFGTNLDKRFIKLNEELNELKDALYDYFEQQKSGNIDYSNIKDEMGDVLAVMTHVCSLIGTDPRTLFFEAVEKIEIRKTNPNYKRTHPHITEMEEMR